MIKKIFTFLILMFFIPFMVNAEELKMDWQTSLGADSDDVFFGTIQTTDGGYVVLGASCPYDFGKVTLTDKGGYDAVIVKYDKDGNLLWQTSWGGNSEDYLYDIFETYDHGIVAFGYTCSTNIDGLLNDNYSCYAMIVKYDKDGNLLWQKNLKENGFEQFNYVMQTQDGGYVASVCSYFCYDNDNAIIVRFDKDLNLIWEKEWGGSANDVFSKIISTSDDEYIALGSSYSTDIDNLLNNGKKDGVVVKYDKDGNLMWEKSFGGDGDDSFYEILYTHDNGFIVLGESKSFNILDMDNKGETDAIIIKFDKDGNIVWKKSFGGNKNDSFSDIVETYENDFVVIGQFESTDIEGFSNKGSLNSFILKYDKEGNLLWKESFGGNSGDYFDKIFKTLNDELVVFGNFSSSNIDNLQNNGSTDIVILKYNNDGNLLWQTSWGGNKSDNYNGILVDKGNNFIISGFLYSTDLIGMENKGSSDCFIVKYSIEYSFNNIDSKNGSYTVVQDDSRGIVNLTPDKGYELNKIIVKDKNGKMVDVVKLENETYSFDLYSDVSVEVLFKEIVSNPKTGVIDVIGTLFIGFIISFIGFVLVKKNCYRYDL